MAKLTVIRGGRIIDPLQGLDFTGDLWLEGNRVLGTEPMPGLVADRVIDATGLIVSPGLIDIHVHLREPGNEEDETIATGADAALAGGWSTIVSMPNTRPPIDSPAAVEFVILQAKRAGKAQVLPSACVSKNRAGDELAELGKLYEAGAVAFTDDGAPVSNDSLMRRALEYSRMFDVPIFQHCQVMKLTEGGVMNEGLVSLRLGLTGMPPVAEEIMVARDIMLAELTGGHVHIQHLSTARSVELVREGKNRGIRVTAEACPHHISLTDENLATFDSNFKMNPPLRTARDVEAVIQGLIDGTIDLISTDHAPHSPEKKNRELDQAPFGILGLETMLPIVKATLIDSNLMTWPEVIAKLTIEPAKLIRKEQYKGHLKPGADADVTLIDPNRTWVVDALQMRSKSINTPYQGWQVNGRAVATIVSGEVRYLLDSHRDTVMI
ncbi:MAG: dihydroorotase [Isosphaeraceae bacterium]